MDAWVSTIEEYQQVQTLERFSSVLHTAESTLKEDLAPFEFDWFVQTLLSEPVSLIATISARLSDDVWSKVVKDAYKLLSVLVEKHYNEVENYIDAIITQCKSQHDGRIRSYALQCLASCFKRAQPEESASQYINELRQAGTCKGPLAILVGTICEYHPEIVADKVDTIWRNYLNLLSSNKNSDLVCKSLLKGVWSLFKHFGTEIHVIELTDFYGKLTREYLEKCDSAVLPILRDYAALFKEKLAEDEPLRRELWTFEDLTPIVPIYEEIGTVLSKEQLKKILLKEIIPKTVDYHIKKKFIALRVYTVFQRRYGVSVESPSVDVYSLEYQLRTASYETAEAVSWCIESNIVNSDKLLQTAILFYDNLPANRRKDIVINGLLNSPADVMHTTLNFFINETCQDDASLHTYLPLWRDIFASEHDAKKIIFLEKYLENVLVVLENFLEDPSEDKIIPDKLSTILTLTSHILSMQVDPTNWLLPVLARALVGIVGQCGAALAVLRAMHSTVPSGLHEILKIDKCKDEATLCETCLTLLETDACVDNDDILDAIEVILSRRDAEPKTLSMAIDKLEKQINAVNPPNVFKCIQLIEKLRTRKDMVGKDARVLQRDITIFLGLYFNKEFSNETASEENALIVQLRDELILEVPNPIEGTTFKISLNRLLYLAMTYEHEDALKMLLNIICATLCNNTSATLQGALGRAVVALCRASVGGTRPDVVRHAAAYCDVHATVYILQQLSQVKSPAVRRMLAETIEGVLLKEPGSEANGRMLTTVFEEVCDMMKSDNSILKLGGLEITESLLTALKVNRHQTKLMLPTLMQLILQTNEQDSNTVFDNASELYIENIGLFGADVLDSIITDLLKILLESKQEIEPKIYKAIVKSIFKFAAKVIDSAKIIGIVLNLPINSVRFVYLWSELPKLFDIKDHVKDVLDFQNCVILGAVFIDNVEESFALEANLRFLNQYAPVLLEFHNEATLKHISRLIEKLPPKYVKEHHKHLSECLTHCREICQNTPNILLKSFENWSENIPIQNITEHLEKEKFLPEHALSIHALNKMIDIFHLKNPTSVLTTVSIYAKTWAKMILKLFASDLFKYIKCQVTYLSDLLSVSLRFLTLTDVKSILLEGHGLEGAKNAKLGVEFCRFFLPVFINYLVKKPFLLLQDDMESCWVLLNDVVKWCVRKKWNDDVLENVLELVDQLWPIYETKASFKNKHTLLLDLSYLKVKLAATSRPMRWVTAIVGDSEADRDERIALVMVLPGGEEYSDTYRRYASLLPTRLSDLDGMSRAALRALLDALAGNADDALLDIVFTLADGDESPGWWDEALPLCMASLAPNSSEASLAAMYKRCLYASHAACHRLLVPLIRCSPSSVCEKFLATILKESLGGLSGSLKPPSLHPEYKACVQHKTIVLDVLQVLFEKVPASKIESPSSVVYEHIETDKPWHLARELIRLCFKLRDKLVTPDGADLTLARICREFQCAAYKCMCACICMRKPEANIYKTVFDAVVWAKIVDESVVYDLPLKSEWNRHKIRKPVSIVTDGGNQARRLSRSLSRSRVFLRTLSENPLDYDLIEHQDDEIDIQDVELTDSSLNNHPCSGTLTALFQHAASLSHYEWRSALCRALETAPKGVKWLLAAVICNVKEDLKPHATHIRSALLSVVTQTTETYLNSLHIDILNTLISWGNDDVTNLPDITIPVNYLVSTALYYSTRTNIFKMLDDVLNNILKIYGGCFKGDLAVFEDPNRMKFCLKLLLRFANNSVRIPSLLPWLLDKLTNYRIYKSEITLLAELIGLEMSNSNEEEKSTAAARLKKILEEIHKSNISHYVKILHYSGCCDAQQFRVIVDLTQKLPEADKKKCLQIISKYIYEHPTLPEAAEIPVNIKQMVDLVSVDRQLEDLFTTKPQFLKPSHPAKRARVEVTSPILDTIGSNEKYISGVLARKGGKGVDHKLCSNNLAVRFVECFYIAIYLPMKYQNETELSGCMSTFFSILFSHLRTLDNFKEKKLRDEPLIAPHPIGLPRTRTKMMVGSLRSFTYSAATPNFDIDTDTGIDVQVSVEKILDTLLQFAQITPEASMELLTQLLRCFVGRGFDPRPDLSRLLSSLLPAAPQLVVLARHCVDELFMIDGFMETVEELKKSTLGSEGEHHFRLLHEEMRLRCGESHLFVLGTPSIETEDMPMKDDAEFSVEGLVSAFQKLSNWDEVTYQERRRIEGSLPALWTDRERSVELLNDYTDKDGWFGQMAQLYHQNRKDVMKWLRAIDKWPRRQFVASSVIEAMEWVNINFEKDEMKLPCQIQKNDCLAEWAARLMIRAAYEKSINNSRLSKENGASEKRRIPSANEDELSSSLLSRSHVLRWCESANERGLYNLALSVFKLNQLDLDETEILKWLEQNMLASTMMAFQHNDRSEMQKALDKARFFPDYYSQASTETIIGVHALMIQLHFTLESLSSSTLNEIISVVDDQRNRINAGDSSIKNKRNLAKVYETAVLYYDGLWDKGELSKDEIMVQMCAYLGRCDQSAAGGIAALILNRLADCDVIDESAATALLTKIKPIISSLPSCYIDQLRDKIHLFPSQIVRSCGIAELEGDAVLDEYRQCLQLLCHADYLLLQYCDNLYKSLQDDDTTKWDDIFNRMMGRIFENPYIGTDYEALKKYKSTFDTIRVADLEMRRIFLKGIIQDLKTRPVLGIICLSHVCPSLAALKQRGLEKLLRLPAGVLVVKIEEELRVFTDSAQRPCVLTVLTSDGKRRRYLHKNEDLRSDTAGTYFTDAPYTVIPLSEDCGLIEFLEDHKRIRDLIESTCKIYEVPQSQAAKDKELILATRTSSVQNFNAICKTMPPYALRSAIENQSASIQDFINKKKRFLETLSDVTIMNWLFGLCDRHLQNLLYSVQDGSVRCIDWGAILQYTDELPPARLTRNMLAVCDATVLESRLQQKLSALRDSHQFMIPKLKLSFRWKKNFNEKLPYIEGILQGKMVAHQISKDIIAKSHLPHKMKYIELLDSVFEKHVEKERYSVEEQVSCLLLQCTDPWILGVTRSGWEPWL